MGEGKVDLELTAKDGLFYSVLSDECGESICSDFELMRYVKALKEAKRVTKPGGLIFVAYLMNEYSILSYCFDEDRIGGLLDRGVVDQNFHIQAQADELYDYVRLEDINRLDENAGLERVTIFSPDGASDYMRTRLNRMSDETFAHFIAYQKSISERADLIGAGSHVVDVVRA